MINFLDVTKENLKKLNLIWSQIPDHPTQNNSLADSESFKSKIKITGCTLLEGNTKNVGIAVTFKYLRTLEMPLINCETILILAWSKHVLFLLQLGQQNLQ